MSFNMTNCKPNDILIDDHGRKYKYLYKQSTSKHVLVGLLDNNRMSIIVDSESTSYTDLDIIGYANPIDNHE